eukprot:12883598-Prorocentrum_lima.AAC.1
MRGRSAFRKRASCYAKCSRRWRAVEHRRAQIQERLRQTYVKLLHYKYTLSRIQACIDLADAYDDNGWPPGP